VFSFYKNKIEKIVKRAEDFFFAYITKCDFNDKNKLNYFCGFSKNSITKKNITEYEAVHCASIALICKEILKRDRRISAFFDVGCGKGKSLCYVGRKFSKKIKYLYGVDISKHLIKTAKANLNNCHVTACVKVKNAINLKIQNKNCILFLFNPFKKRFLEILIKNNLKKFLKNNIYCGYVNNFYRSIFLRYKIK